MYSVQEHEIQSEQSLFDIGFTSKNYTYYSVEKDDTYYDLTNDSTIAQILFGVNSHRVYHTRAIYGVWDCLGDIGGLFEAQFVLCNLLILPCVRA